MNMTKKEIKELERLIWFVEDLEKDCLDILPKDEDGAYTHNAGVVISKLCHIKNQLKDSWNNDKLCIEDW